jgi:hypothetical protein
LDRLERSNLSTTAWGLVVHRDRYRDWSPRNEELRRAYVALGQEIAGGWDALRGAVRVDHWALGRQDHRRLRALGITDLPGEAEWIEAFVGRALARVPTPEYSGASFTHT